MTEQSTEAMLAGVIVEAIKHAMAPRDAKIAALEQRLTELESTQRGMKPCGVWNATRAYNCGDVVTKSGARWIARLNHLHSIPGDDGGIGWQRLSR